MKPPEKLQKITPGPSTIPPKPHPISHDSQGGTKACLDVVMEGYDTYLSGFIFFGIVTLAVYFVLARPALAPVNNANNVPTRNPGNAGLAADGQTAAATLTNRSNSTHNNLGSSAVPSHIAQSCRISAHGANVLVDGLVAFRFTRAAAASASSRSSEGPSSADADRKDRARILSRLLEKSNLQSIPPKGSTMVLSVAESEVACSRLQRVLYILGSFYNLLVILVGESSTFNAKGREDRIEQLRRGGLSEDVIPEHRIVAACNVSSRVAFVRQIQRVALVLDFDQQVQVSLSRFGHEVVTYGETTKVGNGESKLGNSLLG